VDLELDDTQKALVELSDDVLRRYAGAERAREILTGPGYDATLHSTLETAGLLDLAADPDAGPLAAVLVQERVAAQLGTVSIGPRSLIGPALGLELDGPVALASRLSGERVRFGGQATTALVLTDESAFVAGVDAATAELRTFGFPVASVELSVKDELPPGSRETLARWWRISLAVDIAGTAAAAFELTKSHLMERFQFGRSLASLQAVQHRLATLYVRVQATTWLTRYAAFLGTDDEAAAAAASSAVTLAHDAIWELHQLTGATGFTVEYDLQLMTMRMHALRLELDGAAGGHARALADLRWSGSAGRP
jgi:hypothetical protein